MANTNDRMRGRENATNSREVARADEMEDGDPMVRGTVTDSYTVTPAAGSVQQETRMRQQTVHDEHPTEGAHEVEIPEAYNLDRDRVRWGPIWAGLLTALTTLLLLSLLGLAVGLTTANAGEAVARGTAPANTGRNSAIWGAISALIAFGLGGYVAGRTAAIFNRRWGALNGALVFLLGVPVLLYLASQGLGAIVGSLGTFAQGLNVDPNQVRDAAQNAANQAQQSAQNVTPEQAKATAEAARNTAWGTLLGSLLGLGASALGGMLGTRRVLEVDNTGTERRITD